MLWDHIQPKCEVSQSKQQLFVSLIPPANFSGSELIMNQLTEIDNLNRSSNFSQKALCQVMHEERIYQVLVCDILYSVDGDP